MEEQLLQAVSIASNGPIAGQDPSIVQQALRFLEQVKQNAHEVWSPAWNVFVERSKDSGKPLHDHQQRIFCLSLVSDFLEDGTAKVDDPAQAVALLKDAALQHFEEEYVHGTGEDNVGFIKNKYAQFLSALLIQTYGLPPPFTLLPDLISRMRMHASSSVHSLNPVATDMVLRVLHEISISLGSDVTLRAVRSRERVARDIAIRDEIRSTQAAGIAESVWDVIQESFSKVQSMGLTGSSSEAGLQGWSASRALEVTCEAIRVIGDYASWIDISLIVTPHTVNLLYTLLGFDSLIIRSTAADTLVEIVSKGMKSSDKITLLHILNLTRTISELEKQSRKQVDGEDMLEEVVTFREHLAKLANAVAIELAQVVEDATADANIRLDADTLLLTHLHVVLDLLTDEFDELAEAVLPSIGVVLGIYKKLKRQSSEMSNDQAALALLSPDKVQFLAKLMNTLLHKMKFDDDSDWDGAQGAAEEDESEDEQVGKFLALRKNLQNHAASIASIDEGLFSTPTLQLILQTLDACDSFLNEKGPPVSWQRAELALFAIFFSGEVLAAGMGQVKVGVSPASFVILPPNTPKTTRNKPPAGFLQSLSLNPLGEMIRRFFQSSISNFEHGAVQMQYFDCVVRFAAFFSVCPDMLPDALAPFLDWRGTHNRSIAVRNRVNYLFLRFVKDTREQLPHTFVRQILESLQDVLVVKVTLPVVGPNEDPLEEALKRSTFDYQLDLYEACGNLLHVLRVESSEQVLLLEALVKPLSHQLQMAAQAAQAGSNNLQSVLEIHHLFFALSNIAKGFPDMSLNTTMQNAPWMHVFKGVAEQILATLAVNELSNFKIVRDAARGAFSRMVSSTGFIALPYIPALLDVMLPRISETELLDFFSFLGLVIAKYKNDVASVLDELLRPLLERTFFFLNQDVSGTDDIVLRDNLVRGYLTFLSTIIGADLDSVIRSERNQDQLETVLQSLVFYANNSQAPVIRQATNILSRLVICWLEKITVDVDKSGSKKGPNGNGAVNQQTSLVGFENFVYKTLVGLVFEVPSKPDFDFTDAQSQIALNELCSLAKNIYQKRGPEFIEFLQTIYFPGINCPADLASEFTEALQKFEPKVLKKTLEHLINRSRGIGG